MTKPEPRPRPVLDLARSPWEWVLEVVTGVGMIVCVGIVVQAWEALPERIPIHFGISGRPDGWGSKEAIALLPVVGLVLEGVLTLVNLYPHTWNYPVPITEENARVQYQLGRSLLVWMKAELIWLLALILWQQVQVAVGQGETMNNGSIFTGLIVIFGTVGVYLWQAYRAR